ncbi:putative tetratricopeptide-like helical domain superfamily [Helianthus anomalus]
MLAGYAQTKPYGQCLSLYDQMLVLSVPHDYVSLVSVLSACGQMGKLEKGKQVHDHIRHKTARGIFESNPYKNPFTSNAVFVGLAMYGYGQMLLSYFSKMVKNRVKPDRVTFLGVMVGCSY